MDELLWNPLLGVFSVPFFTFEILFGLWDPCAFLGCIAAYGAHQSLMWRGWGKSNAQSQLMDTVPLGTHFTCLVDSVHYLPWCPTDRTQVFGLVPPTDSPWLLHVYEHLQYHFKISIVFFNFNHFSRRASIMRQLCHSFKVLKIKMIYIKISCWTDIHSEWAVVDSAGRLVRPRESVGLSLSSSLLIFPWSDLGPSHSMFADSLQSTN